MTQAFFIVILVVLDLQFEVVGKESFKCFNQMHVVKPTEVFN